MHRAQLNHQLIKYKISGQVISAKPGADREIKANNLWMKESFNMSELMQFEDAEFLNITYRSILKRYPDHSGFKHYLAQLEAGISREKLIAALRYSEEGRNTGVSITGLKPRLYYQCLHLPYLLLRKLAPRKKPTVIETVIDNE